MRVVVCSDGIGALSSLRAGRLLAAGWPQAQTAVVPVGEAGAGFLQAATDALAATPRVAVVGLPGPGIDTGPIPFHASSQSLGLALAVALEKGPRSVYLDLSSDDVHDGGAGLLAGLGAVADVSLIGGVAGLAGITELDLGTVRGALAGIELIGVVPSDQRDRRLLGLRGITSLRGRESGTDPAQLLTTDATLERLASVAGVGDVDGAGACGGVGLAVLALGGRISTGPELMLEGIGGPADLVVTGCSRYDFAARGGGVVAAAAQLAARLLCPCVVLAEEVLIGGREMRTMGVEAAYPIEDGAAAITDRLRDSAVRVGRSWRW